MRDRLITIAALLFIAVCAVIAFVRIDSHYSPPDGGTMIPSPAPLVPVTTSAAAAATASPVPRRTVTTWTTVTAHPATTAAGEDGQ